MPDVPHRNANEANQELFDCGAEKPRLRRTEVPAYLARRHGLIVARSTLAKLASAGGGPRFQKVGRMVLYPLIELDQWSEEKLGPLKRNTSEH